MANATYGPATLSITRPRTLPERVAAIGNNTASRFTLALIDELLATIQRDIQAAGDGHVSEETAIALVRLYSYRRECIADSGG